MWDSHMKIKVYSVTYFDHIGTFEARTAELLLRVGLIQAL